MSKVVLDTNLYVDWIGRGLRPDLMLAAGLTRYLCAIVLMELRAGASSKRAQHAVDQLHRAHAAAGRLAVPTAEVFGRAGAALGRLRAAGREIRRASFVHDVLIALTAREMGATVYTADGSDFEAIRRCEPFSLHVVA